MARPQVKSGEPEPELAALQQRSRDLLRQLCDGLPADRAERSREEQARWLLGHLQEFHRREKAASAWELYHLKDMVDEDWLDTPAALAGLELVDHVGGTKRCPIHRYRFPAQECDIRQGDPLHDRLGPIGTVAAVDPAAGTIAIKKPEKRAGEHPGGVFTYKSFDHQEMIKSLQRIAVFAGCARIVPVQ